MSRKYTTVGTGPHGGDFVYVHRKTLAPADSVSSKGQKQMYWTTSRKLANKRVYRFISSLSQPSHVNK